MRKEIEERVFNFTSISRRSGTRIDIAVSVDITSVAKYSERYLQTRWGSTGQYRLRVTKVDKASIAIHVCFTARVIVLRSIPYGRAKLAVQLSPW
jgi:hypothetical protein